MDDVFRYAFSLNHPSRAIGELIRRCCRVPAAKSKVAKMKIAAQSEVEEEPYSGWSEEDDEKKSPSPRKGKGNSAALKAVAHQINKKE